MRLRLRSRPILIAAALAALAALPSWAATYYVAPTGAVPACETADGSQKCPWAALSKAFGSGKIRSGDTILLMDGDHAGMRLFKGFDQDVTIQSQNAQKARLGAMDFGSGARHIRLRNLRIWRDADDDWAGYMIRSLKGATFLTFENLDIRSREDADEMLGWSVERWGAVAGNGFELQGTDYVIRNCTVRGTRNGIFAMGRNGLVENNIVDGFVNDGLKAGGGSNSTWRNNLVMNRFKINNAHADGFQAYGPSGTAGLTLEGNTILEWTHAKTHPMRGSLQGIGLFDGPYDDLVIRNNIVATRHFNGISVLGTRNARIVNNTVVNIDGLPGKAPWVRVTASKKGMKSQNATVANNLAMQFQGGDAANKVVFTDNSVIFYPAKVFENIQKFNYKPKTDSGFVDSGNKALAPAADILGNKRPVGKGVDRGAFELGSRVKAASSTVAPRGSSTP